MKRIASDLLLTSALEATYRDDLERLMFFNPQQEKVRHAIIEALERFGEPFIHVDEGLLRIATARHRDVQALFALDDCATRPELVGVVVYLRDGADTVTILHVAVRDDYTATGARGDSLLVLRLVNEVRSAAARVKGIQALYVGYGRGLTRVPVR